MNPIPRGHPINRPPLLQHSGQPWPRPSSGAHMHGLYDDTPYDAYASYRQHGQEVGSLGQQNNSTSQSQNPPRVRKSRWSSAPGDTVSQSYQPQYLTPHEQIYPPGTEPYQEENSTGSLSQRNSSSGGQETSQPGPQFNSVNYMKRKREEDNSNPTAGTVIKKVKRFCAVCNIQFINAEALVNHEKGLVHQQKIKDLEESKKKAEEKKIKEEEKDDDDDDDTSYCKYCNQSFNDPGSFYKHTRGMLHTQNLMAAESKKTQQVATERGPFTTIFMPSAKEETKHIQYFPPPQRVDQEEDNWMELCLEEEEKEMIPLEERDLAPSDIVTKLDHLLHCEICNVTCSGDQPMRQHLEGNKHRAKAYKLNADYNAGVVPKKGSNETEIKLVEVSSEALATQTLARSDVAMIGLQYVTEFQPEEGHPRYVCNLCESKCDISTLLTHVGGVKHRMKYLKHHHKDIYYHLTAYNNTKKKSELNAACETFASDIVEKYGQEKVRVKLEISQRSSLAAEAILKTSGVSITDRNLVDFLKNRKELANDCDQDGQGSVHTARKGWPTKTGKSKISGKPVTPTVMRAYDSEESDTSEYSEEHLRAMMRLDHKDSDDKDSAEHPYLKARRKLGHGNRDEMDFAENLYLRARRRMNHNDSNDSDHEEDPYLKARKRLGHDDSDDMDYAEDPYLRASRRKNPNEYDSDDSRTFGKERQVFDYEHRDRSASPGQVQVFEYGNKSVQKQVFDYDNKSLRPGGKQVFEYGNKSMRAGEKRVFEYENRPMTHKEKPAFDHSKKSSRQSKVDVFDYSNSSRKQQKRSMSEYDDSEEIWDHDYRDESFVPKFRKKELDIDLRKDPSKVKKKPLLDVDDRQTSSKVGGETLSAKEKKATVKSERETEETEDDFGESERLFKEFMKWRKAASKSSTEEDSTSTVEGTKSTAAHQTATSTVQPAMDPSTAKNRVPAAPPHQIIQTMANQAVPGVPAGYHVPSVQTPGQHLYQPPAPSHLPAPQQTQPPVQQITPGQSQHHAPTPSRVQPPVSAPNQQLAPQRVPPPSNKSNQPGKSILKNTKDVQEVPKKVNEMLGALSQTLIKSEDEAAMALQVSNALTQALLKFRLMKAPVQKGKSGTGDSQSEAIQEQNKMISQLTQHHMMQSMVQEESVHKQPPKSSVSQTSAPGRVPAPHTGPVHSQPGFIHPGHSQSQPGLIHPVTGHSQSQPGLIHPVTGHSQSQPGLIHPVTGHSQSQPGLIHPVTGHSQSQPGLIHPVTGHSQSQPRLIHPMTGSGGMVQNVPYHTQTMTGNIPQRPPQQNRVPLGAQQFNAYSLKGQRGEVKEKEMEVWKESMRKQALAQTYIQPPLTEEMPPPPPPPPPHKKEPLLPLPKSHLPPQKQGFQGPIRMKVANVQKKDKPLIQNHHPHFGQPKS